MTLYSKIDKKRMSKFTIKWIDNHFSLEGIRFGIEFTMTKKSSFTKKAWWFRVHLGWRSFIMHYVRFKD